MTKPIFPDDTGPVITECFDFSMIKLKMVN